MNKHITAVQPLILSVAGQLPTIPTPSTLMPGDDGYLIDSNIMIGQMAFNVVDDIWYSRALSGIRIIDMYGKEDGGGVPPGLINGGDTTLHYHSSDRDRSNHTGVQTSGTISDFQAAVSANDQVLINANKVSFPEAPINGRLFGRYNGSWVEIDVLAFDPQNHSVTEFNDVISAGSGSIITQAERNAISENSAKVGFEDTPDDGIIYARTNGAWVTVDALAFDPSMHSITEFNDVTSAGSGAIITNLERNKLDGIEEGANKNVQADWNATSGDALILNKPTGIDVPDLQEVTDEGATTNNEITVPSLNVGSINIVENAAEQTIETNGGDVKLQLGRSMSSRFRATELISRGQAIYAYGGETGIIYASLASSIGYNKNWYVGVAGNNANSGEIVELVERGIIEDVDTNGLIIGQPMYLGETPGSIVLDRPKFPAVPIVLGTPVVIGTQGAVGVISEQDHYDISFDGAAIERQDVIVRIDSTNSKVYLDVEKLGGGDLPFQLDSMIVELDCTTGAGDNGRATVELILGTSSVPAFQMVYVDLTGGIPTLKTTTSYPPDPFVLLSYISLLDYSFTESEGPILHRRTTMAKEHDGRGRVSYMMERSTVEGVKYWSGCTSSAVLDQGVSPNTLDITVGSGIVYQNHRTNWPELIASVDGIYVANASGNGSLIPYQKLTNLTDAMAEDATGNIDSNNRGTLTIFGTVNKSDAECKLYVNLPRFHYAGNDNQAYYDYRNYAITSVPDELRLTSFLVASIPYDYNNGVVNFINPIGQPEIINILGTPIGVTGGGSGTGAFIPPLSSVLVEGNDAGGSEIKNILDGVDIQDAVSVAQLNERLTYYEGPNDGVKTFNMLVSENGYLGRVNVNSTDERVAPQPVGGEQSNVPSDISWDQDSNVGAIRMEQTFTYKQSGFTKALYVGASNFDIVNTITRLTIENVTKGTFQTIDRPILQQDVDTLIAAGSSPIAIGDVVKLSYHLLNITPGSELTGGWNSSVGAGAPTSQSWITDNLSSPTIIAIDDLDLDGDTRETELASVSVGSSILISETSDNSRFIEAIIDSVTDFTGYTQYTITTSQVGSIIRTGKACDIRIVGVSAQPTVFDKKIDSYTTQPDFADITSALYYDGVLQAEPDTTAYRVRVVHQSAYVSPDYQYLAWPSGGSVSNEGSGGGESKPTITTGAISGTIDVNMDLNEQRTVTVDTDTAITITITPPGDTASNRTERDLIIDNTNNPSAIETITFDDKGGTIFYQYEDGDPVTGLAIGAILNVTIINIGANTFLIKTNPAYNG